MGHTAETKRKLSKARAKQIFPTTNTKPHRILQEICTNSGIIFENEKLFDLGFQMHRVDIFIEPNICLEADGDRPHANPNPFVIPSRTFRTVPGFKADDVIYGVSKSRKKPLLAKDIWEIDRKQTKALKQLGNKVLRFWHSELETKRDKCIKKILKTINA